MRRRMTIVAVLVAGLVLVPAAQASGEEVAPEVGTSAANPFTSPLGLVVRGSNGFDVVVGAAGRGEPGRVRVEAEGAHGSITYTAPGSLSDEGIQANLGRHGLIDMHWVPDGRLRELHFKCHTGGVIRHFFDTGAYVGTLRFRGGGGFTSADADEIAWSPTWYSALGACGISVGSAMPGAGEVMEAGLRGHMSTPVHFFAYRPRPGAKVEYDARSSRSQGRIKVFRQVFTTGDTGSLELTAADGRTRGRISPPAPFYGSATFERARGSKGTFTGDFGVEFPDHTRVRLAGKGFEAAFRFESIRIEPDRPSG